VRLGVDEQTCRSPKPQFDLPLRDVLAAVQVKVDGCPEASKRFGPGGQQVESVNLQAAVVRLAEEQGFGLVVGPAVAGPDLPSGVAHEIARKLVWPPAMKGQNLGFSCHHHTPRRIGFDVFRFVREYELVGEERGESEGVCFQSTSEVIQWSDGSKRATGLLGPGTGR
jgi:hypothetical protein